MQIQVNTDASIQGSESMNEWVTRELHDRLARFRDHITRIEVHLTDVNAARSGELDKRCLLEVRLAGRQPIAVTHVADRVSDALVGACARLHNALDATLGKDREANRRETIRGAV
jgi:hypothetical protein